MSESKPIAASLTPEEYEAFLQAQWEKAKLKDDDRTRERHAEYPDWDLEYCRARVKQAREELDRLRVDLQDLRNARPDTMKELDRKVNEIPPIESRIAELEAEIAEYSPKEHGAEKNDSDIGQVETPAVRDEKVLKAREEWQASGRKAKDFDRKYCEKHGTGAAELKRRLGEARKRRIRNSVDAKPTRSATLGDVWHPKASR